MNYKESYNLRIKNIAYALKIDQEVVMSRLSLAERTVKERSGNKCEKCKNKSARHIHHIKPVSKFPELYDSIENLIHLCFDCHQDEHPNIELGIENWKYNIELDKVFLGDNGKYFYHPELIKEYEIEGLASDDEYLEWWEKNNTEVQCPW